MNTSSPDVGSISPSGGASSASQTEASDIMREKGLRPKKSFGQNFLTAEPLCDRIAELALPPPPAGCVLEIGAGATYANAEAAIAGLYPDFGRLIGRKVALADCLIRDRPR